MNPGTCVRYTRSYNTLQVDKIPFECGISAVYEVEFVSEIPAGVFL